MSNGDLVAKPTFSLNPTSIDEAIRFADLLSTSNLVPKEFVGNSGNILVAIQWGMELGLQPMQAMQSIAVINGRPSLWGDAVIALVRSSPLCEYVTESDDGETATCRVRRRGEEEAVRTFSMADAKAAGLLGKAGPWTQYPKRMRQMRARSFALRDVFPDVLRGMPVAEDLQDFQERELNPDAPKRQPSGPKPYPEDEFEKNLPVWGKAVMDGKLTVEGVIEKVKSKGALTEDQITRLRNQANPIDGQVVEPGEQGANA